MEKASAYKLNKQPTYLHLHKLLPKLTQKCHQEFSVLQMARFLSSSNQKSTYEKTINSHQHLSKRSHFHSHYKILHTCEDPIEQSILIKVHF